MTIWSGLGMTYGHDALTSYNTARVESDFAFLKSRGMTKIRIVYPAYTFGFSNCDDMSLRAMADGFYVVWGVATGAGYPTMTLTQWTNYKSYVIGTLVPWARTHGLSELCIGNECDSQADGVTVTAATVRSDIRAMCVSIKSGGYPGNVSYNASATLLASWISEGIGSLDLIGFNDYASVANFTTHCNSIFSSFGTKGYISEFGSLGGGYPDFNDENLYATDTINRINAIQAAGIPTGHFFCYRDGGGGVTANTFGIVQSSGVAHCVRGAILNTPGQKIFSSFSM